MTARSGYVSCACSALRSTHNQQPSISSTFCPGAHMPLVRASVPQHIDDKQLKHISDSIHDAMVATFNVPADDRFQVLTRHATNELVCAPKYLDIAHTSSVVFI